MVDFMSLISDTFKIENKESFLENYYKEQYNMLNSLFTNSISQYIHQNFKFKLNFLVDYGIKDKERNIRKEILENTKIGFVVEDEQLLYVIYLKNILDVKVKIKDLFSKESLNYHKEFIELLSKSESLYTQKIKIHLDKAIKDANDACPDVYTELLDYIEALSEREKTSIFYNRYIPYLKKKYDYVPTIYHFKTNDKDSIHLKINLTNRIAINDVIKSIACNYFYKYDKNIETIKEEISAYWIKLMNLIYDDYKEQVEKVVMKKYNLSKYNLNFMDFKKFNESTKDIVLNGHRFDYTIFCDFEKVLKVKKNLYKYKMIDYALAILDEPYDLENQIFSLTGTKSDYREFKMKLKNKKDK